MALSVLAPVLLLGSGAGSECMRGSGSPVGLGSFSGSGLVPGPDSEFTSAGSGSGLLGIRLLVGLRCLDSGLGYGSGPGSDCGPGSGSSFGSVFDHAFGSSDIWAVFGHGSGSGSNGLASDAVPCSRFGLVSGSCSSPAYFRTGTLSGSGFVVLSWSRLLTTESLSSQFLREDLWFSLSLREDFWPFVVISVESFLAMVVVVTLSCPLTVLSWLVASRS